ncbi:MAG TPA: M20 family peptidase [Thermoanaerobaculia bacterium]|nr:M20 family peptidase [Thermoanaerobaculia bacterium]
MLRRTLLALGGAALLLLAVLVANAVRAGRPQAAAEVGDATALPLPPVDLAAASERLATALRFRTVSLGADADGEPAEFHRLHDHLAGSFPAVHRALQREVVAGLSLLYTWRGGDAALPPVLLLAHQDVVPVEPGTERDWPHPPFAGTLADGFVWGRGALDDKGSLLAILEAAEALAAAGFAPRRTVYLAFGHDEEVGGVAGAGRIAQRLAAAGVRLEWVLDEGGFFVEDVLAGVAVPVALVGIAEKGYLSLELTARGAGGHSSAPPPRTAIGSLARAVARLEADPFPARLDGATRQMFAALAPELPFPRRLAIANLWLTAPLVARSLARDPALGGMVRTTLAPTLFHAGAKDNVLPQHAVAVVNLRILPGDTVAGATARVRRIIDDPTIEVRPLLHEVAGRDEPLAMAVEPSAISATGSPGFRLIARSARAVRGDDVVVAPYLLFAGTDSKHFAPLADDVYRFAGSTLGPGDRERVHGTGERIAVEDYGRMIELYRLLLQGV